MVNETVKKAPAKKATKKVVKKKVAAKVVEEISVSHHSTGKQKLYSEGKVVVCVGELALTAEQAKTILGWRECEKGELALLTDRNGMKIICTNNRTNRPFYKSNAEAICQEILRGNWVLNYENMIIGEYGNVLSAQHRLIGFILAVQEYENDPDKWPLLKETPTLDCCIAFGCSEDEKVINTIDTGKTRSLSDVIYRSEYFRDVPSKDRRYLAKACDFAIKLIWYRTGEDLSCGLRKTHAELLDFLSTHQTILECVKYVWEENDGKDLITRYSRSLGVAAGLLYLMATSKSDPKKYMSRTEQDLDLSNHEKAEEFWTCLAVNDKKFQAVRNATAKINGRGGAIDEKIALICKAWNLYVNDKPLTDHSLELKYHHDDDEVTVLAECPTVGGIDIGSPEDDVEDDVVSTESDDE